MADSRLLLIAKARDDFDLRLRLLAALAIQATSESQKANQSANSKLLSDYAINEGEQLVDKVFNLIASTPALANKIKKVDDIIITSDITDEELSNGLAAKWEWLASYMVARNYI